MDFLKLPLFNALNGARKVLVAGAGGGYDVFTGLPLYFGLRSAGLEVYLANLTFSVFHGSTALRLAPALFEVTAETETWQSYCPEVHLARWFRARGEEIPIYCFPQTGVQPLLAAYRLLLERLGLDTVILVDGGTDSLMRGDEAGLGTPHEDITSIAAVGQLDLPHKLLVCLGFGIDTFHGVCHGQVLEAVAEITRAGGFLGAWSLTADMPEVQLYREASAAVFAAMPDDPSIVSTSILSAIEGHFGDYHATERTQGSRLFINPLMTFYWSFQLDAVAQRIMYLDEMRRTETFMDIVTLISRFQSALPATREWTDLPM
jgi:hypothetical protein